MYDLTYKQSSRGKVLHAWNQGFFEKTHALAMNASEPLDLITIGNYRVQRAEYEANKSDFDAFINRSVPSIKTLRERTGLTQAAFADKYEIPKRTIENWESGSRACPEYTRRLLEESIRREYEK